METITLTKKQARRFLLAHQGLWPPYALEGKGSILSFIRHVGCIQFDPLDVVGQNPELVLQSRIDDYCPVMLKELLYKERKLLDDWDKMMAIHCVEDWPYFYYRKQEAAIHSQWRSADHVKKVTPFIRKAIEERGPLSSIDLDHDQKVDWPWGPARLAKAAMDNMYYLGELIIHHKVNTRKVYDLASRHIPSELLSTPDPHQTQEEYHDWHVFRRIGSVGLLWSRGDRVWKGIYGAAKKERIAALTRLITQDKAVEVQVEGIKYPIYMRCQDMATLDSIDISCDMLTVAAVIAPLDNLLWDRELIEMLFGFKYRWEVYKPVKEREYGYYVLPVLYGDRFVARFEPGQDKKSGALVIKNWWWEKDVPTSNEMYNSLKDGFRRFLKYLGMDHISIKKSLVKKEGLNWLP